VNDERARLFVALELPSAVRTALVDWRSGVMRDRNELRPVASEALHVTLCFLGWRSGFEIDAVASACSVVAGLPAAELVIGDAVWLPPRRPRVLAVSLSDPGGALAAVQSALSRSLHDGGWYQPESRPFLAHVTVARVPKGARVRRVALDAPAQVPVVGSTVTLFRSRLGAGGARYEALASVSLAGLTLR
jgi:RNA 2',3'-cyclic 3'-phosphodiesterase